MVIVDTILIGGLRFVLDKVAAAVETELNDDTALRESCWRQRCAWSSAS